MTDHHYEDPAVRGQGSKDSGVECDGCGRTLPVLVVQWGAKFCRSCKPQASKRRNQRAVALEDIDDVVSYVERYVERRFPQVPNRDEYVAEGIALTYHLHAESWKPELQPSFRRYLSTLLWQRLKDYYRRDTRQAGMGRRTPQGFEYTPVDSLDALRESGREPASYDALEAA